MRRCSYPHRFARARWVRCAAALFAATTTAVAAILACSHEFPISFLDSRDGVLLQAPEATFAEEVRLLVPAPQDATRLKPVEDDAADSEYDPATGEWVRRSSMDEAEREGLTAEDAALVRSLRELDDGALAFARGEGLPRDVRHYTAGAVSFHHGQPDSARAQFAAVLALPAPERTRRELWSRFMLGRLAVARGDAAEAASQFEVARELVRSGAPDPLGLAVSSLGEEARLSLVPGRIARAVALYGRQASYGSGSAIASLLRVVGRILKDDTLLDESIQDSLTRRLLFLYLNARVYALQQEDGTEPAAPGWAPTPMAPLERVVAALERHRIGDRSGICWLAATAYQAGRFDLAERLANGDTSAVSTWIRAKLACRRGNMPGALSTYSEALAALEREKRGAGLTGTLLAESAVVRLGRGQFSETLDIFFRATQRVWAPDKWAGRWQDYWRDTAYVAERVLTTDELKKYVDEQVKAPTSSEMEIALEQGRTLPAASLRWLLGRRLMREQRYREAIGYFDDEHVRSVAEEYVSTMARTHQWWRSAVSRAEDLFAAATITRFDGMELLSYELSPDYMIYDGQFSQDPDPEDSGTPEEPATPQIAAVTSVSSAEKERVETSKPTHNVRFHYQVVAVDHAMKAADYLPRSSQAFAAVLCRAAGWVAERQPEVAATVYARYLHEGPYVRWARRFGRQCPQPDFNAARRRMWVVRLRPVVRLVGTHPILSGVPTAAVLVGAVLALRGVAKRRRARARRRLPASVAATRARSRATPAGSSKHGIRDPSR